MLKGGLLIAAVALALPAFAGAEPSGDDVAARAAALEHARELWQENGTRDYRFQISFYCFCASDTPCLGSPCSVVVRDGRPARTRSSIRHDDTVPELFQTISRNLDDDDLRVHYSRERGVPRLISTNPSIYTADEEITYEVDRFRDLSSPRQ